MGLLAGTPPAAIGAKAGRLAPCKRSPNCVSSQADQSTDPRHFVAPLGFRGSPAAAWAALKDIVRDAERARIVREEPGYLRAEFTSRVLGFVDDVEFLLEPTAQVIHVRSASRLGYGDFGVNRSRVEAIRRALAAGAV